MSEFGAFPLTVTVRTDGDARQQVHSCALLVGGETVSRCTIRTSSVTGDAHYAPPPRMAQILHELLRPLVNRD